MKALIFITNESKPFEHLFGLTVIERIILAAEEAGIDDFFIITRNLKNKLKKILDKGGKHRKRYICYKKGGLDDLSVIKGMDIIKEKFILLVADYIFEPKKLLDFKNSKINNGECVVCVDENIDNVFDIENAMKVYTTDNKINEMGKNLKNYNAVGTGMFLCYSNFFKTLELEQNIKRGHYSLTEIMTAPVKQRKMKVYTTHNFWMKVNTKKDLKQTEKIMLKSLIKKNDGLIAKAMNRPISIKISKYLSKTNIKPNTISYVTFIIALLSAIFFSFGTHVFNFIAGLVAQFASILDGCDGEIAKLKFSGSYYGGFLDSALDNFSTTMIIFGMSYGYWLLNNNINVWIIAFFALFGMFWESYFIHKFKNAFKERYRGFRWIKRDLQTFIIMLGGIFNQVLFALLVLAVLTNFELFRRLISLKST